MSNDISGIIKSTGNALERQAFTQFGAAVEQATSGSLRDLFKLPEQDPSNLPPTVGEPGVWAPSRYAAALVKTDQVELNPKLKFLFKVTFQFDPALYEAASTLGFDLDAIQRNASFLVRHIDRPKFDFDYEEVNMYNFRTKILKSIRHREVGFTLYDDVGNNALSFVNVYRMLMQPIARTSVLPTMQHEDYGFNFDQSLRSLDTSMRGILPSSTARDVKNVLTKMTINQIFVERGSRDGLDNIVKVVDFEFINPRFTNIDIDDLDHENGGNFNIVTFTTDFDTMYMSPVSYGFSQEKNGPNLPTGDIPANSGNGISEAGGRRNPFIDIIVNQGSRVAQQSVSNLINKTLGGTAGGRLIAGQLTGVGGVLAEAGRRTLTGMRLGASQAISISQSPMITDNSVPSNQANSTWTASTDPN